MTLHKLTDLDGNPVAWPRLYRSEETTGPSRLAIAASNGAVDLVSDLAELCGPEVFLLLVVVAPRGQESEGRYQSPLISSVDACTVLNEYRSAFEQDGRHHLWLGAPDGSAMIVYDHHNVLYVYGPIETVRMRIEANGYREGSFSIPSPHTHCFHAEFDADFSDLLSRWDWHMSELQPGDDD